MRHLAEIAFCLIASAACYAADIELKLEQTNPELVARFAKNFPDIPLNPELKYKCEAAEAIPQELQGTWFQVLEMINGKPELGLAWAKFGKSSQSMVDHEVDAPIALEDIEVCRDGSALKAVVYHMPAPDPTAYLVRLLPHGLIALNSFNSKTGQLFKLPAIMSVK